MALNYIEVIPSPNKKEVEVDIRSLNVITQSKGKKDATILENKEIQTDLPIKKKRGQKPQSRQSKKVKSSSQGAPKHME